MLSTVHLVARLRSHHTQNLLQRMINIQHSVCDLTSSPIDDSISSINISSSLHKVAVIFYEIDKRLLLTEHRKPAQFSQIQDSY